MYVNLVRLLTESDNWQFLRSKFKEFSKNEKIRCLSLPVVSLSTKTSKAEQVTQWWQEVEQKSISLALDYEYITKTDVTDCYSAIYTHSIAWALHSKQTAKKNRNGNGLLGNQIDSLIQDMRFGQTNGIPQGSVLMDFISEIVLGYADVQLSVRIEEAEIIKYQILRYRDDYRIFASDSQSGEKIVKILTEIMLDLGMKLNPAKTSVSNDIVRSSIKEDKLTWIAREKLAKILQKQLLIIHNHALEFPNTGSLVVALMDFNKRLSKVNKSLTDTIQLIGITIDIAFKNPRAYAVSAAIVSKLLSLIDGDDEKINIIKKIKEKFNNIPNTGYMQIWLQRVSIPFTKSISYEEKLCRIVEKKEKELWNNDFISNIKLKKSIDTSNIIDDDAINRLLPVIQQDEIDLFVDYNI